MVRPLSPKLSCLTGPQDNLNVVGLDNPAKIKKHLEGHCSAVLLHVLSTGKFQSLSMSSGALDN